MKKETCENCGKGSLSKYGSYSYLEERYFFVCSYCNKKTGINADLIELFGKYTEDQIKERCAVFKGLVDAGTDDWSDNDGISMDENNAIVVHLDEEYAYLSATGRDNREYIFKSAGIRRDGLKLWTYDHHCPIQSFPLLGGIE